MYRKKYSAVCLLLLVLLWLLSACGNSKSEKYSEAVSLMENNNYNEAIEIFTELADYEDASAKLSECKYALGQEAITAEEWKTAISYFANLNYKDSNELLAQCEKEKGMHENADYDFLADLEKSVLSRIDTVKNTDYIEEIVVDTELAYIGKYANAIFYDSTLKSLADKYIEGLNIQKDGLKKEYIYQRQIEWLRGITIRYEALSELYNDYGFLSDNAEFIATYVSQVDSQRLFTKHTVPLKQTLANKLIVMIFRGMLEITKLHSHSKTTLNMNLQPRLNYPFMTLTTLCMSLVLILLKI